MTKKKKNIKPKAEIVVATSDEGNQVYHVPVMLNETIDALITDPEGIYVDVTFGGGGHSREILSRLTGTGHLFGFDQDEDAIENIPNDSRFTFVRSNFKFLKNFLRYHEVDQVDGILADLGVSSHHFDEAERGFSFRFDGALDMRMNNRSGTSAATILNTYTEEQLADIFYLYGELHNSRRIAKTIVQARVTTPFDRIFPFVELLKPHFGRDKEKKDMARVFQALRIEVNQEMDVLRKMLEQCVDVLKPNGRLVVLTYHSLEDRLVKNFIRTGNFEGKQEKDFYGNVLSPMKAINSKVIVSGEEEIAKNPRARSAKLRIAQPSPAGQK